jgi:hypothetical protein
MSDAKCVPQDDISIGDALGAIANPSPEASGRLTGALSDVVASGPEFIIGIWKWSA